MVGYHIWPYDCRDAMRHLIDAGSVHTCVTSPPYFGLRNYEHDGQLGLEQTPDEYVAAMVEVFREVRRVLRDDGTLWVNIGDTYARPAAKGGSGTGGKEERFLGDSYLRSRSDIPPGLKKKDLIGVPWLLAFALRADGWYLRQEIIWAKPNPKPESVKDRFTKSHEQIFLLSKSKRYYFDHASVQEPAEGPKRIGQKPRVADLSSLPPRHAAYAATHTGLDAASRGDTRNPRDVWTVPTKPYRGAHFATFPPALIERCILAGAPEGGIVLDPFGGSGTTALVANRLGRNAVLCELNPGYVALAHERIAAGK